MEAEKVVFPGEFTWHHLAAPLVIPRNAVGSTLTTPMEDIYVQVSFVAALDLVPTPAPTRALTTTPPPPAPSS